MLKGKAKIDFEQWYESNHKYCFALNGFIFTIRGFRQLPQTMQQGVLLEFFREKNLRIGIFESRFGDNDWRFAINDNAQGADASTTWDYSTAFTHAIDKACELYNGKGE